MDFDTDFRTYFSDQPHNNASDPSPAPPCKVDHPTISQDEMQSLWIAYAQYPNAWEGCCILNYSGNGSIMHEFKT